jgi:hypothetical protein
MLSESNFQHFALIGIYLSITCLSGKNNKKFREELIAYFLSYDTGHSENDASKKSSIIECVFVIAIMFLLSRCLATIGRIYRHTQTAT